MSLSIVPIYRVVQNASSIKGNLPSQTAKWFLNKEEAQKYLDTFYKRHDGHVYVKMHEEYSLFDGERYFSLGKVISIEE